MLVEITNDPRDYAWGSATAIAEALGRAASGGPEAELWLGGHPGSPARVVDPGDARGARTVEEWIARDPAGALGPYAPWGELPFLLKFLAAARPLSLQAHPSTEQAVEGFGREDAAGIPVDAPHRNYRDRRHKPEMVVALSETFEALCGFAEPERSRALLETLRDRPGGGGLGVVLDHLAVGLDDVVGWLLRGGPDVDDAVAAASATVGQAAGEGEPSSDSVATAAVLAGEYPGDPGIVLSLLMNRVTLRRGEALYLPAGNLHAYLAGLGLELMAASDNVLRGGLTPKHVDVDELLSVLDTRPLPVPALEPTVSDGVRWFRPGVRDFALAHLPRGGEWAERRVPIEGPAIVVVTGGTAQVAGARSDRRLERGDAVYATPEERVLRIAGDAEVFVATVG